MSEKTYRDRDNNPGENRSNSQSSLLNTLFSSSVLNFLLILVIIEVAIYCLLKLTGLLAVVLPVTVVAFVAYLIYILVKRPADVPKSNVLKYFASVLFWIFIITLIAGAVMPWIFWAIMIIAILGVVLWAITKR